MSNIADTIASIPGQELVPVGQPNPSSEPNLLDLQRHIFSPEPEQQLSRDLGAARVVMPNDGAPDVDGDFDGDDFDDDEVGSAAARSIEVAAKSLDLGKPSPIAQGSNVPSSPPHTHSAEEDPDHVDGFYKHGFDLNFDYFNADSQRAHPKLRDAKDAAIQFTNQIERKLLSASPSVLPKSPKLLSCLLTKKLALSVGIKNREGAAINYEGGNHEVFCQDISQELETSPFLDERGRKEMVDAFLRAPSNFENLKQTASSIRDGNLVILPTEWRGHATVLVFYQNHFYICNRGEGAEKNFDSDKASVLSYEIDPTRMSADTLGQIRDQWLKNGKEGIAFFKETLPLLLSRKGQGAIGNRGPLENSKQKVGNCGFASTAQALFLVIHLLSGKDQDESKEIYQKILLNLQLGYLDRYIYHTEGFSDFDAELVLECASKLDEKLEKFPDFLLSEYPHAKAVIHGMQERLLRGGTLKMNI